MQERRANALINEKSPYLLQHAFNPVNWYPWNEEALRKAREEDKPILLSIGYSSCHWCHVMEKESFENDEIAEIINKNFIPIKVDREERPDLDDLYMKAVQALTGQGGWPLNVFLTPDLKPFFGGTYFPPQQRYGLPGFKDILEHISRLWKEKRDEIVKGAELIFRALSEEYAKRERRQLSIDIFDTAYTSLIASFDPEYGGFGGPPKFPLPTYVNFLLRYYKRKKKELALRASIKTLECIANGGIHDQIGGGFHRYSTDRNWLIPHFEKMLYDNALLAIAYIEAFQVTHNNKFLGVAKRTLDWMLLEMMDKENCAFYSAQDADTEQGEGVYYTWTQSEINAILGEREGSIFCYHFGITKGGNFEGGRSIPYIAKSLEDTSSRFGVSLDELDTLIQRSIKLLYEARIKRERPSIDYKIITSWNSLVISALCRAYQTTREERYIDTAKRTAEFIIGKMLSADKLLRRYAKGEAGIDGTLEDYAFLTQSLIDLFESTFETRWLEKALELNERTIKEFWDESDCCFLFSSSRELPIRIKDAYDGPLPSGNSVAILNLLRLYELTGNEQLKKMAEDSLRLFYDSIETNPSAHTYMLLALDFLLNGSYQIIVVGDKIDSELSNILFAINQYLIPSRSFIVVTEDNRERLSKLTELINGKDGLKGKPTIYICKGNVCMRQTNNVDEVMGLIQ